MKLKNKTIHIHSDGYGKLFARVYDKDKSGVLTNDRCYKFVGVLEGVDVEVSIPKGCRTEYAKIIKVK